MTCEREYRIHVYTCLYVPPLFLHKAIFTTSANPLILLIIGFTPLVSLTTYTQPGPPTPPPKMPAMADMTDDIIVKDFVLIGAGHAHAFVLKNFGMKPEENVRLTLISEEIDTPYSGMLPGFVSGVYTREETHIDALRLSAFAQARFIKGRVARVDTVSKLIYFENDSSPPVEYDVISINVGISPEMFPGFSSDQVPHVSPVKPISKFTAQLERIETRFNQGQDKMKLALVGGGVGGVELSLCLRKRFPDHASFTLFSKSAQICPSHNPRARKLLENNLKSDPRTVLLTGFAVLNVVELPPSTSGFNVRVHYRSETTGEISEQDFHEVIWCTNARGPKMLAASKTLPLDAYGCVKIQDTLQIVGFQDEFAAGDCAEQIKHPHPKAGVFAVRQGPILAENIRLRLRGQHTLTEYIPQRSFLGLITTANGSCVASKGEMGIEGEWLWELKDWIDRTWMRGYSTFLPEREHATMYGKINASQVLASLEEDTICELKSTEKMRCGGCGSKVGSSVLSRVVSKLAAMDSNITRTKNNQILMGLSEPDDCAALQVDKDGSVILESVDFFRSFWMDEYVFAKIATNHSLSDVHAMGSDAVSALCIAQIPFGLPVKSEQRLFRMMRGALDYLNAQDCALVGGHTCEGREVAMGFAVTGVVPPGKRILKKGGFQLGDVIILTKALGTGTIMAANMRVKAKGAWVQGCLDSMTISNRAAGKILLHNGATACTDVTGFGLMGHLLEMIKASDPKEAYCASLRLNALPLLDGALEIVSNEHILSSLQGENVRSAKGIANRENVASSPRYPLLFDPQTAGGLLACVPAEKAEFVMAELITAGYPRANVIGVIFRDQELRNENAYVKVVL